MIFLKYILKEKTKYGIISVRVDLKTVLTVL